MERGETTAEFRRADTHPTTGATTTFPTKPSTTTTTSTTTTSDKPASSALEGLRQRVTLPTPEKLGELKRELPRAIEQHWASVQSSMPPVPRSIGEAWDALPTMWRYTLFSDAFIFWPLLGFTMLLRPLRALDLHARLAGFFHWAAPTSMLASNTTILYVQTVGALCLAFAFMAGFAWYRRDGTLARAYSLMRLLLAGCLLYATFFGHHLTTGTGIASKLTGTSKTNSLYYILLPFAAHSVWHAGAILTSGPEFWRKLLGRVPTHLQ